MSDKAQRTAKFLAVVIENAELRVQLAETQDMLIEMAVDAGELHARIDELQAQLAEALAMILHRPGLFNAFD
jgi:uncharacterized protein involved in exopolysaccharide biosynthesis